MDFARRSLICFLSFVLVAFARAADAPAVASIEGTDGWRFLPAEKNFADKLMAPDLDVMVAPAVDAIADFQTQLQAEDIALLVVPVPPKIVMAPDAAGVSAEDAAKMRAGWERILAELRARGVKVFDLAKDYTTAPGDFYCRRDTRHRSCGGRHRGVAGGSNRSGERCDRGWIVEKAGDQGRPRRRSGGHRSLVRRRSIHARQPRASSCSFGRQPCPCLP
jgi:hypothetical protein